jgi:hypothetical protein
VYGFIGTPPAWRRYSRLAWKQGPCHLVEEVLSPQVVATLYQLGPQYMGSLQAPELNGNHIEHIMVKGCQFHNKLQKSVLYKVWYLHGCKMLSICVHAHILACFACIAQLAVSAAYHLFWCLVWTKFCAFMLCIIYCFLYNQEGLTSVTRVNKTSVSCQFVYVMMQCRQLFSQITY